MNLAVWLAGALAACFALGCLAAVAQQRYAPLVLFPLLFGLACGAFGAWFARVLQVGHRPAVTAGTVLAVSLAVFALHWYSYRLASARARDEARQHAQLLAMHPEFAKTSVPPPPTSLGQFLNERAEAGRPLPAGIVLQGSGVWGMWTAEALIVLAAALAVVIPALRSPYCDRCRTWYRGIRRGTLSLGTSKLVGGWCQLPAETLVLEYRLLDCASGCGPTGLELSWPVTPVERGVVPAGGQRLWLSEAQRKELMPMLDADARRVEEPAVGGTGSGKVEEGHGSGARSEPPKQA